MLTAHVRGDVIQPGDAGYDDARAVQNGLIDRRPAVIVRCRGAADVVAAVNLAREQNLLLSVRGGGHNVAGNAVNDGGLVIDLSEMRGVHVDQRAQTARVAGGATWGDVDHETQLFGLATPGGLVSTTGVAGLTLHGGMGHLRGKYGLSIDNLISVDIVTADGQLRTASATEHTDLFWAVRGAGSNFGVVTSFEFKLHPVGPTVMLAAPVYALEDAPQVLRRWRELLPSLPDELTMIAVLWSVPEGFPEEFVGREVLILAGVYAGPSDTGERVTQPLRELGTPLLDLSEAEAYVHLQAGFDPFFPKGQLCYWKSTYVEHLSDDLLDTLCQLAAERPSPLSTVEIWPQNGAVSRVSAEETAFGRRPPYMLSFDATWTDPADNEVNVAWDRSAHAAMQQFSAGGAYLNFPGLGEEREALLRAAYGEANYARLVDLKTKYDPANLFRMNQNIRPRTA
jgi:FAD/FMN-containing dehydrogenase